MIHLGRQYVYLKPVLAHELHLRNVKVKMDILLNRRWMSVLNSFLCAVALMGTAV